MIYRPAEEKDRDAIQAILTLSFNLVYAKYAKMSFKSLEKTLVAVDETRLMGVINWRIFLAREEKIGYLFWLAIHPDFRRKGIGVTLVRKALEILGQQKVPVIYTSAEKENLPSRSLFEQMGFTRIRKGEMRKRYGKDGPKLYRDMWVMPWEDLFLKNARTSPNEDGR